jgi:2',3'-cyclic-nucleotide 2'-phosphodiesterase
VNILFVGDIFGSAGRHVVREHIGHLVENHEVELLIMNAENAAGGFGVTPSIAQELFDLGADVLTTGNHVWDKKELIEFYKSSNGDVNSIARRILRPANFPAGTPGWGFYEGVTRKGTRYAVINLQGRVFMANNDDPFRVAESLIRGTGAKVIFIDMHAEATSEKIALGWYLDGKVTAVIGTHTHIPTADERVLPNGTAYQTDVGMSGPYDSVIGIEKEQIIQRFLSNLPGKFEAAKGDPRLSAVLITCDPGTGKASAIKRLMLGI